MKAAAKNLRKLGWKEFNRRWKQGMMRLTPEQLLDAEITGYGGSVLGTIGAGIVFVLMGLWPIMLFLSFNIVIQGVNLVQKWQQREAIKKIKSMSILEEVENV